MKQLLRFLPLACLLTLLLSCESAPASSPEEDTLTPEELGPNAALIRNPVDQGVDQVDTVNIAKFEFADDPEFKFGTAKQGEVVSHNFIFTNSGSVPLLITDARSTCGCTVSDYPEAPIAPGEESVIKVNFDTKNKYGRQRKSIALMANTYPAITYLYVDGEVINE
ncbi:MAG: DUF1573 domain-containing protein [Bacteroidota bacterium]